MPPRSVNESIAASVQAQLEQYALQTEQQHAAASTDAPAPQAEPAAALGRAPAGANGSAEGTSMLQASASALAALQQQQAELLAEKADLQALCGRLTDSEAALNLQCSQLKAAQTLLDTEARDAKEQLVAARKEAEQARATLQAEMERMQQQLGGAAGLHAAKDALEQRLSDMQHSTQAATAALQEQLARAEASAGAHDAALKQRTAELEALAGERDTLAQQCAQLQALQASYRARITDLEAVCFTTCLLHLFIPLEASLPVTDRACSSQWCHAWAQTVEAGAESRAEVEAQVGALQARCAQMGALKAQLADAGQWAADMEQVVSSHKAEVSSLEARLAHAEARARLLVALATECALLAEHPQTAKLSRTLTSPWLHRTGKRRGRSGAPGSGGGAAGGPQGGRGGGRQRGGQRRRAHGRAGGAGRARAGSGSAGCAHPRPGGTGRQGAAPGGRSRRAAGCQGELSMHPVHLCMRCGPGGRDEDCLVHAMTVSLPACRLPCRMQQPGTPPPRRRWSRRSPRWRPPRPTGMRCRARQPLCRYKLFKLVVLFTAVQSEIVALHSARSQHLSATTMPV